MDEEKLKKWLESNVIGNCKYGTEWKDIMRKDLDDVFERRDENE